MERVISDEEKIRRAIQISQRRNQNDYAARTAKLSIQPKKNYKLFKKMILQILICLCIYFIFYLITTTNYVFSDQVIKTTTSILNYDINLQKLYKDCENFVITTFHRNEESQEDNLTNMMMNSSENVGEINSEEENTIINQVTEEKKEDNNNQTVNQEKSAMELDAEKVKKLCKFQKPLSGTITSEFGEREVTSKIMSADHKGIDIAAKSGTSIKAAMDGVVSVASQNSEYGKFIKIVNGEVMTVYAHCNKLKVKEGDKVKKGKIIATVGSTGNSTGPHLHFEIRLSNRYINPRYIIKF